MKLVKRIAGYSRTEMTKMIKETDRQEEANTSVRECGQEAPSRRVIVIADVQLKSNTEPT